LTPAEGSVLASNFGLSCAAYTPKNFPAKGFFLFPRFLFCMPLFLLSFRPRTLRQSLSFFFVSNSAFSASKDFLGIILPALFFFPWRFVKSIGRPFDFEVTVARVLGFMQSICSVRTSTWRTHSYSGHLPLPGIPSFSCLSLNLFCFSDLLTRLKVHFLLR